MALEGFVAARCILPEFMYSFRGPVRAWRIQTELNGYVCAPPRNTTDFDQRRRVWEGFTQMDLNGSVCLPFFVAVVDVLCPEERNRAEGRAPASLRAGPA